MPSLISLFRKRQSILGPKEREAAVAQRLQKEKNWVPAIQDLFSGKYGPQALDSNIWIWDYEDMFERAYQTVASEIPSNVVDE